MLSTLPEGAREIDAAMSNFDHSIDDGFDAALRAEPMRVFGSHYSWNFCAYVWFDGQEFVAEVWRYNVPQAVHRASTLPELMRLNNEAFGSE